MKFVATFREKARTVLEYITRPIPESNPPGNATRRRVLISLPLSMSRYAAKRSRDRADTPINALTIRGVVFKA